FPVAHRRRHQRFDRAELKLLTEEPHCDQREDQDEGEPEEDRIEECFLNGVRHLPPVHERELEVEIDSAEEEEEEQNDVGDGRVEVAPNFAAEQGEELSHLNQRE